MRTSITAGAALTIAAASGLLLAATGGAATPSLTGVPSAQPKITGFSQPNILSPELRETPVVQGSFRVENPSGPVGFYGYLNDGPLLPAPGDVQAPGHDVEASKTEPDKNTYLVLSGEHGADPGYDYGTHFLFQGHEAGAGSINRVNLDADGPHRVTVLATTLADGTTPVPTFDGSTWDPFTRTLLFTAEGGPAGGAYQATPDYPSTVNDLAGILGRGGFEGIQVDKKGEIWIVEDSGGVAGTANPNSKQPNSFIYRFVPNDPSNIMAGGALQVLQARSQTGQPIVFHPGQADADITSQDRRDLHTYGLTFQTHWITVHDTATDGTAPFSANAAAKAAGGTPFKRPENGMFRPDDGFKQFYFTETGDTTQATEAGSQLGGFGAVYELTQSQAASRTGSLRVLYVGDLDHNSFDNIAFFTKNQLMVVEDRGDGLHATSNELDSGWILDPRATGAQTPLRFLAEGRDDAATIDSALGSISGSGFQNEGDNEITGIHISDGDPTVDGLLGRDAPRPFKHGWRVFWTQQHGDNITWEILPANR